MFFCINGQLGFKILKKNINILDFFPPKNDFNYDVLISIYLHACCVDISNLYIYIYTNTGTLQQVQYFYVNPILQKKKLDCTITELNKDVIKGLCLAT